MTNLQRVDCVVGARPNFMKMAPLLRALEDEPEVEVRLIHTGQHYDQQMSDVFFEELGLRPPDVRLEVGSDTHARQTARVLERFEECLLDAPPRGVVVAGDVNSTLACTLAAAKLHVPVAHLEAGLRSGDRRMPEEINRVVVDAIADVLLVTEPSGRANLLREGVDREKIHLVGNLMIDTLVRELPDARALEMPARLGLEPGGFGLVTLHRPSNVDDPDALAMLVDLLVELSARLPLAFPVHPRTRGRLESAGLLGRLEAAPGITLAAPLGYRENLGLMSAARVVLTDSGGVQEETSALGVPCLTLRENTERPVTVVTGTNTLVGSDPAAIRAGVAAVLEGRYKPGAPIPLWDGHAAERAAGAICRAWGLADRTAPALAG